MKNFLKRLKLRKVNVDELDDRTLLINVYATQIITLIIALIILVFQGRSLIQLFHWSDTNQILLWGIGFTAAVIGLDITIGRYVPEDVTDDGGINERIFGNRPIWHIALLSFIVAVCEETLFRGAIQYAWGPYWTSILFAAIHIRYLRHWLMTGLVFGTSYGLGWIYIQTNSLWTPICAHFLIDLIMGIILKYRRNQQ
jgi:membrane protease YdiL (CAAX protease family)